jgi:accessory gene regulator B
MISKLAVNLTQFYVRKEVIPKNKAEIYTYGFELLFSTACNVCVVFCIAIAGNVLTEAFFFLISFISMRSAGGGYHAKTHLNCIIAFSIVFLVFVIFLRNLGPNTILLYIFACATVSFLIVWTIAPVEAQNRPLSARKKENRRNLSLLMEFVYLALALASAMIPALQNTDTVFLFSGGLAASLSMVAAKKRG